MKIIETFFRGAMSDRFTDNKDGTITDSKTDLIWKKDAAPGTYFWDEAVKYCEGLGEGWRLPTIAELISIVDHSRHKFAIDPVFNCRPSYFVFCFLTFGEGRWIDLFYWSSTTTDTTLDDACAVDFHGGREASFLKSYPGVYVRAVRGITHLTLEELTNGQVQVYRGE